MVLVYYKGLRHIKTISHGHFTLREDVKMYNCWLQHTTDVYDALQKKFKKKITCKHLELSLKCRYSIKIYIDLLQNI